MNILTDLGKKIAILGYFANNHVHALENLYKELTLIHTELIAVMYHVEQEILNKKNGKIINP